MKIKSISAGCFLLLFTALSVAGCTKNEESPNKRMQSLSNVAAENGMQAQIDPDSHTYQLGDTDPVFSLKPDQTQVQCGDQSITLPDPPKVINGELYLTPESVTKMFKDYNKLMESVQSRQNIRITAAPLVDANNLIAYAKQYMGVPYRFGSKSFPVTHTFDCSSYVQYVYGHFGIRLPRASKDQAKVGQLITYNNLQPGDIIFFYTPGRYASNRIVGHVGIYIGNNQVLHTFGKPGVTISDLTRPSWNRRFLHARRVM